MEDDLKDSLEPPLRLHDHPQLTKHKPISSPSGRFKTPFTDKVMINGLALQIKDRRLHLGWDERELSRQSGVNAPSINRIECGDINGLHFDVVLRVVKAMGLELRLEVKG